MYWQGLVANTYFELFLKSHFLWQRDAEINESKQDTGKKNKVSLLSINIIIYFYRAQEDTKQVTWQFTWFPNTSRDLQKRCSGTTSSKNPQKMRIWQTQNKYLNLCLICITYLLLQHWLTTTWLSSVQPNMAWGSFSFHDLVHAVRRLGYKPMSCTQPPG